MTKLTTETRQSLFLVLISCILLASLTIQLFYFIISL